MKIAVVGLGLIGGSLCKALCGKYDVYGTDYDEIVKNAVEEGAIIGKADNLKDYEVVFLCTPPSETAKILERGDFEKNQIVCDFCGIKREMAVAAEKSGNKFRYVGCHPMAGREISGFSASEKNLFSGASLITVVGEQTDKEAVEIIKQIGLAAGFEKFPVCDADFHDRKIAYTSQLAHIVSGAYIKSEESTDVSGYTGGSFQDMTRVAAVNEQIWKDLFMGNKDYLLSCLENLIENLTQYKEAVKKGDENSLLRLLKEAGEYKKRCFEK